MEPVTWLDTLDRETALAMSKSAQPLPQLSLRLAALFERVDFATVYSRFHLEKRPTSHLRPVAEEIEAVQLFRRKMEKLTRAPFDIPQVKRSEAIHAFLVGNLQSVLDRTTPSDKRIIYTDLDSRGEC